MKTYTFKFNGRQAGAIGIFYDIRDSYKCSSLSEAKSLLYEDYEHIRLIYIKENTKDISKEDFDKALFITVRSNTQRDKRKDGSYIYSVQLT